VRTSSARLDSAITTRELGLGRTPHPGLAPPPPPPSLAHSLTLSLSVSRAAVFVGQKSAASTRRRNLALARSGDPEPGDDGPRGPGLGA
jgi:hypothetical protein